MSLLRHTHANLLVPRPVDIRKIFVPLANVSSMLLRLFVDAHSHIHCYRSIFRYNISIPPTHENLHLPTHTATDMDFIMSAHISLRLLHENHGAEHRSPGGDAVRGGLADRGYKVAYDGVVAQFANDSWIAGKGAIRSKWKLIMLRCQSEAMSSLFELFPRVCERPTIIYELIMIN